MKAEDQIQAIREILAHGEEGMVLIEAKHLFEMLKSNEKRVLLAMKASDPNPITSSDVTRHSEKAMPGGYIKKAFESLEILGLIRRMDQKGAAQPYEFTVKGRQFATCIETK